MAYKLEGKLLEVCTCEVICPCWVGADPDNGECKSIVAWHFESGDVNGTDVSGLTLAVIAHIPGNVLDGNWRAVVYMDDNASQEQEEALLSVYTGKEGGPVADLVQLIGEVVGVERVPVTFEVEKGEGTLRLGTAGSAELEAFKGATGELTTFQDTVFSTIPGSPAYVSRAPSYKANVPALGIDVDLQGHSAVQGHFEFVG